MKKRWSCFLLCLLLLLPQFCRSEEPWILAGYLYLEKIHTAQDLKALRFEGLTHVNLAFAAINEEYLPVVDDGLREKIRWVQQEMQEQGASGKVILSIGGWGCSGFCYAAQDEAHREAFAQECRRLVEEYGLDGVDIDWEYPVHGAWGTIDTLGEVDKRNYTLLLETLRRVLGKEKIISLAFAPQNLELLEAEEAGKICDMIYLMAYDYSPEEPADLEKTKEWMAAWMQEIPARKLVLGVPFYGRSAETKYNGIAYQDIKQLQHAQGWQIFEGSDAARLWIPEGWIAFDSPRILSQKKKWTQKMGMGGMMIWELSQDADGELLGILMKE